MCPDNFLFERGSPTADQPEFLGIPNLPFTSRYFPGLLLWWNGDADEAARY